MRKNLSQQATKQRNKLGILDTIRRSSHISQAHIAQELKLRPSTVSNLSRELMQQGLIEISGKGEPGKNGGKRSQLLSLSSNFASFSGIYIHQDHIVSHLIDLQGNIQETAAKSFGIDTPDTVTDIITAEIARHEGVCANYRGAGIAVSSVVSSQGDVSTSPDFPWEIAGFTGKLSARTGSRFPIVVENDANCAAVYMYHAFKQRYRNLMLFLYSHTHRSLGAGIVVDGKLYRGSRGDAGEIIHQEKQDIVSSFSAYIARLGTFFSPDHIVLLGDDSAGTATLSEIHGRVCAEVTAFPVTLQVDPNLPVLGTAHIVSHMFTQSVV